jgi:hypothetical protein
MRKKTTHPVFDVLIARFGLKNDTDISRLIGFQHSYIWKLRNRVVPGSSAVALAIHETFGMPIAEIRSLGGDDFVGISRPTNRMEVQA